MTPTPDRTLCFPDGDKSCFFCCPPIRPAGADPLDGMEERRRLLRRHRHELEYNLTHAGEIDGHRCWGLGFLDDDERLAGCLLHPAANGGRDLRDATGYRLKCATSRCREAEIFARLTTPQQDFFLDLAAGLDSFHYSSRRANPLMKILPWDRPVLEAIYREEGGNPPDREAFSRRYGFLWRRLDHRLDGFLVAEILKTVPPARLRDELDSYTALRRRFVAAHRRAPETATMDERSPTAAELVGSNPGDIEGRPAADAARRPGAADRRSVNAAGQRPVHLHHVPLSFSRLCKFGLDTWETDANEVNDLLAAALAEVDRFRVRAGIA
ncbi:MAG: hypothetical protein JW781_02190 [Deltaproteobacteria bacterium]|nr:hypothetical protein [Candidatus Anaeroferrophillacea bacterium]